MNNNDIVKETEYPKLIQEIPAFKVQPKALIVPVPTHQKEAPVYKLSEILKPG